VSFIQTREQKVANAANVENAGNYALIQRSIGSTHKNGGENMQNKLKQSELKTNPNFHPE
jgi:hypothetical protein